MPRRHGMGGAWYNDLWSGIKSVASTVGPPLINLAMKRYGLGGSSRRRAPVRRRHLGSALGSALQHVMRLRLPARRHHVSRHHYGGLLNPGGQGGAMMRYMGGRGHGGSMIPLRAP